MMCGWTLPPAVNVQNNQAAAVQYVSSEYKSQSKWNHWILEGSPLMSASKDLLGCGYLCAKLRYCKHLNLPNPFSAVFILHSRWIFLMDLFVLVTEWGLSTSTEERRMLSSEINAWQYDAQAFPVRAGSIFRPDALVVIFKVTYALSVVLQEATFLQLLNQDTALGFFCVKAACVFAQLSRVSWKFSYVIHMVLYVSSKHQHKMNTSLTASTISVRCLQGYRGMVRLCWSLQDTMRNNIKGFS